MNPVPAVRRWLRSVSPVWLDAGLVLLVLSVQLWPFFTSVSFSGRPWHWWGYAVVAASAVPLVWRRRAPAVALLASLVAIGLYDAFGDVPAQPIWYGALVLTYAVAAYASAWPRQITLVVTVGGAFVISSSETALRSAVLFVAAYAIGRAAAASRAHAERLEHERRIEAERAAERERARIARDMHDILSHAVSVMVVQAEAGPVVLSDPPRAEAVFDAIASAGRDAMVQLRRILDVLSTDGSSSPQPTLGDLPKLVDHASNTGLTTTYAVSGTPLTVSADVEIAVYRITQEAITNVVKHAGAGRADIRLVWQDNTLMLDIVDDGGGSRSSIPSGGNGLIGIRERAAACGGSVTVGPRAGQPGFQVTAEFPAGGVRA
jgi:signal transduction histidine kinase